MSHGAGRRTLYLYGLTRLCIILAIMSFLDLSTDREAASVATAVMIIL